MATKEIVLENTIVKEKPKTNDSLDSEAAKQDQITMETDTDPADNNSSGVIEIPENFIGNEISMDSDINMDEGTSDSNEDSNSDSGGDSNGDMNGENHSDDNGDCNGGSNTDSSSDSNGDENGGSNGGSNGDYNGDSNDDGNGDSNGESNGNDDDEDNDDEMNIPGDFESICMRFLDEWLDTNEDFQSTVRLIHEELFEEYTGSPSSESSSEESDG